MIVSPFCNNRNLSNKYKYTEINKNNSKDNLS